MEQDTNYKHTPEYSYTKEDIVAYAEYIYIHTNGLHFSRCIEAAEKVKLIGHQYIAANYEPERINKEKEPTTEHYYANEQTDGTPPKVCY